MDNSILVRVCEAIADALRESLCPGVLPSGDTVGICTPSDKGDFALGINLVDVQPASDMPNTGLTALGSARMAFPAAYADMYVMITSYSAADIKYRAAEDCSVMGHVFRVLYDIPVLTVITDGGAVEVPLQMPQTVFDHKLKLWVYPDTPYRLSLLYKAGPVPIGSGRTTVVSRVWGVSAGD